MTLAVVRVAAVSDIHSPLGIELFRKAMEEISNCDIFLLAGDLVERNDWRSLPPVIEAIRSRHRGEILACFGNEEYDDHWEIFRGFKDIRWINDDAVELEIAGVRVGVVISRGSLDRPTFWQRTHIPNISKIYEDRVGKIDSLLSSLASEIKMVVTHYSPTYQTLEGEKRRVFEEMGCRKMEEVIKRRQPDAWFHGHAHNSTRLKAMMGKTAIFNVSLPATGRVTVVDLPMKVGLEQFF
ncbi:MAG: metallophosphoesterase [Candidatus Hadarchaeales archaeon]